MLTIPATEFERTFKQHYKPLCLFALHYTSGIDDAEDIVQQAFAETWEKNLSGSPIDNIKSYLYRAVRNRAITFAGKQANVVHPDEFPEIDQLPEEEQSWIAERDDRLWNAIDKLPPERKKIFLLAKRDGLKYQEIADELRISVKTVENQMGKALKALRETAINIYNFILSLF